MQALVLTQAGAQPRMALQVREIPQWRAGYSLIRVHAATVNPLSNWIRLGSINEGVQLPLVLSNDGAGIVKRSGSFTQGTAVAVYGGGQLGITEDGLQQEWALIADDRLVAIPAAVSLDAAAALPVNYVTAHQALHRVGAVQPGDTVVISGASGSVGHALIELVNACGATAIAVVSSASKGQAAVSSGAKHVVDTSAHHLVQAVGALTGGNGADWALDVVGGPRVGELLSALRRRGTLVSIGFSGATQASLDIADLVIHEKRLLGYDAHLETDDAVRCVLRTLFELAAQGVINPRVDSRYPMGQFEQAYARLASRQACGTVLLTMNAPSDEASQP